MVGVMIRWGDARVGGWSGGGDGGNDDQVG